MEFISEFIEDNGHSPSLEEIAAHLGLASLGTVHKHVSYLIRDGLLTRRYNVNRSLVPVTTIECPSCGTEFQRGEPRAGVPCPSSTEPGPLEGPSTGRTP